MVLYYMILYYMVLSYMNLYYMILYYMILISLNHIILCYIILNHIMFYYVLLYYIAYAYIFVNRQQITMDWFATDLIIFFMVMQNSSISICFLSGYHLPPLVTSKFPWATSFQR